MGSFLSLTVSAQRKLKVANGQQNTEELDKLTDMITDTLFGIERCALVDFNQSIASEFLLPSDPRFLTVSGAVQL